MSEREYVVYKHTNLANGKIYIGITCQKPTIRWRYGKGYPTNQYLTQAFQKYGWNGFSHEILYENLTKEEAEAKEIELIALYQTTNRLYGYNLDNGGSSIGRFSEESRKKMSESAKHRPPISEETRERLAELMRGNQYAKGKKLSEEHKAKLLKANKGKHRSELVKKKVSEGNSKPVVQLKADGTFVHRYKSIQQVNDELHYPIGCISRACSHKQNGSHGFLWFYEEEYKNYKGNFSEFMIVPHGSSVKHELKKRREN